MIWLPMLLTAISGYMSIHYIVSKRWACASITLTTAMLNVGSMMMYVEVATIDAATARFAAKCVGAPKQVPYRPGMSLCPGQTAVIHIPDDLVVPSGTDI